MPDENGKYTQYDIDNDLHHGAYLLPSDTDSSCTYNAYLLKEMLRRRDADNEKSGSSNSSSTIDPEMAKVLGVILASPFIAAWYIAKKSWQLGSFLAIRYWRIGDENLKGKDYLKAKAIKIGAPIFGWFVSYAAHGLHQKYVVQPRQERLIAEQQAAEAKRRADEIERREKQKQEDLKRNQQLDQAEFNPLNTSKAQDNLRRVFSFVQQQRLSHYVVVDFPGNKSSVPTTKVLVPPAQKLDTATSLYVCTAHPLAMFGRDEVITECSHFAYSPGRMAIVEKVEFPRAKKSYDDITYGEETLSMITQKLSKRDARRTKIAQL